MRSPAASRKRASHSPPGRRADPSPRRVPARIVSPDAKPPAASVLPSFPSVANDASRMPGSPERSMAAARAISWFLPPLPGPDDGHRRLPRGQEARGSAERACRGPSHSAPPPPSCGLPPAPPLVSVGGEHVRRVSLPARLGRRRVHRRAAGGDDGRTGSAPAASSAFPPPRPAKPCSRCGPHRGRAHVKRRS